MRKSPAVPRFVLGLAMGSLLLVGGVTPVLGADEVFLTSGARLTGDVQDSDVTLVTPGATYRLSREQVWRVMLSSGGTGDIVELRNGTRLSGRLDRPGYALRLPGGDTRSLTRGEIAVIKLGAPSGAAGRQGDVIVLQNGDWVAGDLSPMEFDMALATGSQRFQRDAVWRLWLDSAAGDGMQLSNGDRLSGVLESAAYEITTRDGQTLRFRRDEVKEIMLRQPDRPRPAASVPGGAVAVVPGGPAAPPTVPPAALPPAVRAVLRDLQFEFDKWELTPEARKTLEEVASALKAYPSLGLLIEGHADERGTAEYNLALGARRAQSAKDYLVGLGIDAGRLDTISYGEERPLDPTHNEVAWALNRRAHFAVKR
jgi:peptidoglycan-associated lipoprotein